MRQENPALTQPPPATSASPAPEETRPVIEEVGVPEAPPAAEVDPAARGAASEGDPVAPAARTANAAEEQPARSPAAWWALLLALIAVGVAGWSIWQARRIRLSCLTCYSPFSRRLTARLVVRQRLSLGDPSTICVAT